MKKTYLVLSLFFLIQWSQAQIVNIPDANFKNYLLTEILIDTDNDFFWDSTIDLNNDGEIQESEALLLTSLYIPNRSIASLEGIEYFTNLEELVCSRNPIPSLSVPNNVNLKTISYSNSFSDFSLTSVDVSQNVNLEYLNISGNDQISTLDVSQNVNLENLSISGCNFTSIDVSQNMQLREFNCNGNSLTNIDVSQNLELKELSCNSNPLNTIDVTQNVDLESLSCVSSLLTNLDVTQNIRLRTLNIGYNDILNIDLSQNPNLQSFDCPFTLLTTLDFTQNPNLKYLDCENNSFTTLDLSQNLNLEELNCFENSLTTLDLSQNINLKRINCSNNLLTSLDVSDNSNLTNLTCDDNLLQSITTAGATNLINLKCNNNSLTAIDITANTNLKYLQCNNNSLTQLDLSQNSDLLDIECNDNSLITLDASQNPRLDDIECYNNQLEYLNIKNGINSSIYEVIFYNNPTLEFICVDQGELAVISPNMSVPANAIVSTYCSFTPGGEYTTVQGTATLDLDTNGCDMSDAIFPSMEYQITNGSSTGIVIADATGDYSIYLSDEDSYTITPQLENPTYFTVSPTSLTIDTSTASNPTIQDFCITPNGTHNDVEVTIVPVEEARPGFDAPYQITYKNKGTSTRSGTVQLTFDDDLMDLVTSNPMSDVQALNSLTWNYTNLMPQESRTITFTMNINTPTDVPAVNGNDILNYEVMITPTGDDETPDDNVLVLQQTVVNSFDPNDITCIEGETVTTDYINKYVHYMIRFENTGTASAVNVIVTDVIDETKFDVSTLTPTTSSHAMVTNIKNTNEVEFIFENINLPFDDASNDGYLVFKIKTLASLVENDVFENQANIFFDFNVPIATNTASTLISNPLSISEENLAEAAITLYPNPAKETIHITANEPIEKLELHTIEGRRIQTKINASTSFSNTIDVSSLPAGIYLMNITTTKGKAMKKIVKQ